VQSYLNKTMLLGRPTYLSPDSGFTAILFYLLFCLLPSNSLNGTQPKPVTCSEVSAIWKRMSEI